GMQIGSSEAEPIWTEFLRQLTRRGLRGVKLVISDAHEGIKAAVTKVLCATWQRCRVGLLKKFLSPDSIGRSLIRRRICDAGTQRARSAGAVHDGLAAAAGARRPCSRPGGSRSRSVVAAGGGRRTLLRDERTAGDRSRGSSPADARGILARDRA